MAVKTFGSEILTSSDVNTYLANAGLVYVTQQSFTGVSTFSMNSVFTSTYSSYRVMLLLNGSVGGAYASFRMRASGSDLTGANYYRYGYTASFGGGLAAYNSGGGTSFLPVGEWGSSLVSQCIMDISEPMTTNRTNWLSNVNNTGGGASYNLNGLVDVGTAFDGFTVYPSSGTMTGTIYVYGYRKA